jgi:hypothetical protein
MATNGKRRRTPWNKGKIVGQKVPLSSERFGQSASGFSFPATAGTSPYSTWLSTR